MFLHLCSKFIVIAGLSYAAWVLNTRVRAILAQRKKRSGISNDVNRVVFSKGQMVGHTSESNLKQEVKLVVCPRCFSGNTFAHALHIHGWSCRDCGKNFGQIIHMRQH